MKTFVLKISTDYEEMVAQVMQPSNVEFAEELEGYNSMSCQISLEHPDIAQITEHKKCALYEVDGGTDILIWSGYVDEPTHDLNWLYFSASDEKRFLKEARIVVAKKTYSAATLDSILTELVDEANTRSGGDTGNLSYVTDLGAETIDDVFEAGTDYYSVMTRLAEKLEAQFTVRLNVIYIQTRIGTDRSAGANFYELSLSKYSPNENNISKIEYKRLGNQLVNYLLGVSGTSSVTKTPAVASEFPHIEKSVAFGDDLDADAQNYVDKNSVSQAEIEITLDPVLVDFHSIHVGDLLHVRVNYDNTLTDFEDDLEVIYKKTEIINGEYAFQAKVSTVAKQVVTGQQKLYGMEARLKTLELL